MKTDDRDERLASILDDAVRDIDAFSREAPVGQSSVRVGRAGRVIAAVAAAAVFVGGVVFASGSSVATRRRRQRIRRPSSRDRSDGGWQLERTVRLVHRPSRRLRHRRCPVASIVSNVEFEFLEPRGRDPSCNERIVLAGFPSDGVAIDLEPQGGSSTVT